MEWRVRSSSLTESGRVFDKSKAGARRFYEKLHIADGFVIPTALGVNPSLTVSAMVLRIAEQIIKDL
jgi:cholesterol oxidase